MKLIVTEWVLRAYPNFRIYLGKQMVLKASTPEPLSSRLKSTKTRTINTNQVTL
jgi:hypothetical protein